MNALAKARKALGFEPAPVNAAEVVAKINPKFFVVPDELKADPVPPADISETIANAAKEAADMIEHQPSMTESYRASLETHKTTVSDARARIVGETEAAEAEHNAQIERLNDEIKSRNEAHAEYVKGQNERVADADKTLSAINASLADLDETPGDKRRAGKPERPTIVRKLHGSETETIPPDIYYDFSRNMFFSMATGDAAPPEFFAKWKDRSDEFPTTKK